MITIWLLACLLLAGSLSTLAKPPPQRAQGLGVKIGEVTQTSAILWTRVPPPGEKPIRKRRDLRELLRSLFLGDDMQIRLRLGTTPDLATAPWTDWEEAESEEDSTHQFVLRRLQPRTRYYFELEAADEEGRPIHQPRRGSFRTAPVDSQPADITFVVATCQHYGSLDHPEGFLAYDSMGALHPDFMVMAGDAVYYDRGQPRANTIELARERWRRMYQLPKLFDFHAGVPAYWQKDDHDVCGDECNPGRDYPRMGEITFEKGLEIYREQTPSPNIPYRTVRWGKDLQIWLLEGREFRSANRFKDGPGKTIWGAEQKKWFQGSLAQSTATWRLFIHPTPIVGPDRRMEKRDNHANRAWRHEGRWFRQWASQNLGSNFFVIAGDRHWQYHSVDPVSGLEEFACGPVSDEHAGGSVDVSKIYHRFHRVAGGFLSVSVWREGADSVLRFRHHAVNGEVVYETERRQELRP